MYFRLGSDLNEDTGVSVLGDLLTPSDETHSANESGKSTHRTEFIDATNTYMRIRGPPGPEMAIFMYGFIFYAILSSKPNQYVPRGEI